MENIFVSNLKMFKRISLFLSQQKDYLSLLNRAYSSSFCNISHSKKHLFNIFEKEICK